jgi:hypothetical protein
MNHNQQQLFAREGTRRVSRTVRSTALLLVIASVLAATVTGTAKAAVWQPCVSTTQVGCFSGYVQPQSWSEANGDCISYIGPVLQSGGSSSYAKVGGVTVNCYHMHSYLAVTVKEAYSATSASSGFYYVGGTGTLYGSNISGWTGIIHTGGACGHGWWFTRAWVNVDGQSYGPIESKVVPASDGC